MFGLPLEVISMAGSTILGGVMKMMGQAQADKAEQQKLLMERHTAAQASIDSARQYQNPNAAWIRRFIVVTLLMLVAFILIAPAIFSLPTNVPTEVTTGPTFLWGLLDFQETYTEWVKLDGIVTPDWLKFAMLDIIAFYFGTSAVARK